MADVIALVFDFDDTLAPDSTSGFLQEMGVDASVFYRAARYDVQVNIQNVGNRRFYDAAQSDYQIYPAAPVNGTATIRYRF